MEEDQNSNNYSIEPLTYKEPKCQFEQEDNTYSTCRKPLSPEEQQSLLRQDSRRVSEYAARMSEVNAKKNWDLFYKRNETRFFKDRHWTTREFHELLNQNGKSNETLFEVGCGVGNFIFPLIEEKLRFKIFACDLSSRAIEMVKTNSEYDPSIMKVFQCDITTDDVFTEVSLGSVDIITLIFVLSAIHPENFQHTLNNLYKLLKPGGVLLFRDYGLHDMAQLRFKPGRKISDNFYMRQDGTRCYYFSLAFLEELFIASGFEIITNVYVNKRTINRKENVDVPRVFVQSKVKKPVG